MVKMLNPVKSPDRGRIVTGAAARAAGHGCGAQIHERERAFELSRRSTPDSTDPLTGP